jgi:hypothetical protein
MVRFQNPPWRAAGLRRKPREYDPIVLALSNAKRIRLRPKGSGQHGDAFAARKTWRADPSPSSAERRQSPIPAGPTNQGSR